MTSFSDPVLAAIAQFLLDIKLEWRLTELHGEGFLPGIKIEQGVLLIDPQSLLYPGDLLHEAGHLAVKDPLERSLVGVNAGNDPAEEMMAIAWSYAACCHLGLPLDVLFHQGGYKGGSQTLIENFRQGRYFGVPMLQWLGMTADAQRAEALNIAPYPHMIAWLSSGRPSQPE